MSVLILYRYSNTDESGVQSDDDEDDEDDDGTVGDVDHDVTIVGLHVDDSLDGGIVF